MVETSHTNVNSSPQTAVSLGDSDSERAVTIPARPARWGTAPALPSPDPNRDAAGSGCRRMSGSGTATAAQSPDRDGNTSESDQLHPLSADTVPASALSDERDAASRACLARGASTKLTSFDGGTTRDVILLRPDRYRFFFDSAPAANYISRGAGLSYAAASFGEHVASVEHSRFNRLLAFDPSAETIEVEAGITLGELYEFLTPRGLYLATQPGHPTISIGGCIAADVHGKNQYRDGTFIDQVLELSLFHPDHGVLRLSPEHEPELFRLTCGGYGLTGFILSVKLKLRQIPSLSARVDLWPVNEIEELPGQLQTAAKDADFVYSWHDFMLKGSSFGRGFIQSARFPSRLNSKTNQPARLDYRFSKTLDSSDSGVADARRGTIIEPAGSTPGYRIPISISSRSLTSTDGIWSAPLFNCMTVRLLNLAFGARGRRTFDLPFFQCMFPIQGPKELYFKFFGRSGFHEYQCIIPIEAFPAYVHGVRKRLTEKELPITLASAKLFSGHNELLRFTGDGICMALNFPRGSGSNEMMQFLDRLIIDLGGIPNIIKDSRLPRHVVERAYPEYGKFSSMLAEFDPRRVFRSELSERLGL